MATRMYVCDSTEHPSTLLSGLNEQRLKGVLCDVTVRVQGNLFKAHINVLASSMGYFRDLFFSSNKEKPNSVIDIPMIVNTTGFAKILDFVYTSQLCLSQSTVMQVLCSACYLQIPYVVEKCQEFIGTHGHVTAPSSLQEVAAPILQGLQNGSFPKLTSGHLHNQLNRLNEKSRAQIALQQQSCLKQASSPHNQQDTEVDQECTLINTPPSPADRSPISGEINRHSPHNNQVLKDPSNLSSLTSMKHDLDADVGSNDEKMITNIYSPHNKYTHMTGLSEGEPAVKRLDYSLTQDMQGVRDTIDHSSLAKYFSTVDRDKMTIDSILPYPYRFNGQQEKKERQLVDLSKAKRDRTAEKKERPKKEYRCDYCGKLFGRQQHLKRHILTHTGERPYPCTYCEKRFRRSEHLKHHLANHEQALGLEPSVGRKKPRKPARADDAYTMSKMMLGQYAAADTKPHIPMLEYSSAPPSVPVVLPSMFAGQEAASTSPRAQINEMDDGIVRSSDNNDERHDNHQKSPSSCNEQSPMAALNLCRDVTKPPEDLAIPISFQNGSIVSDNVDRIFDEGKSAEGDQNSPGSRASSANATDAYDEVHVGNGIICMEGSEVVTHDLKRLIAAMDK